MITTKAIAFPSGGFPSMWTRIELYSSAEATTTKQYALACRRSTACQQCMKHSSTLGAPHSHDPICISSKPAKVKSMNPLVPDRQHSSAQDGFDIPRASTIGRNAMPSMPGAGYGRAATSSLGCFAPASGGGKPEACSDDANAQP
jgi:hypothetical protein